MRKTNTTITLTHQQLQAIIAQAVESALQSSTDTKKSSAKKTTSSKSSAKSVSKKTTSSVKKSTAPKTKSCATREEALTKAYGDATARKAHVDKARKDAQKELTKSKIVYSVNEFGKIQFAPYTAQTKFESKKEFSQFRETFRKNHPYA